MHLVKVCQRLNSNPLADIRESVRDQLASVGLPPQGPVAITVGSRGIANLVEITRTAGEWLREQGAEPFVIPSMGSHNGATAEGQRELVESLGCTEDALGMPIRSSMECVKVGQVSSGKVWMDRHAYEATGVLVINRVKLHTCFSGPVQSGLTKMMVVGMGKIRSAETFHSAPSSELADMLLEMGQLLIESGKIWAGLAILEDGYDQTAELHALPGDQILAKEPSLLDKHRGYFPRLPFDDLNVLVVDQVGKNFSGSGMDPNVIGRRGMRGYEDIAKPEIKTIAALSLSEASHGNAAGIGLADIITRPLREAINEEKTLINVLTTGEMNRAKIPATFANDEQLVQRLVERFGSQRWVFIPNTLHLDTLWCSEDMIEEIEQHEACEIVGQPSELKFQAGRHTLSFQR